MSKAHVELLELILFKVSLVRLGDTILTSAFASDYGPQESREHVSNAS